MNISQYLKGWNDELKWIIESGKGNDWKACVICSTTAEKVYEIWRHKNNTIFGNNVNILDIEGIIIDTLTYMGWCNPRLSKYIADLLLD